MLISCPNCSAKFAVPVKAIGDTGRKVKCTKCSHIWFQEPVAAKLDNLLKVEYPEFKGFVAKRRIKFKLSFVFLLAILLFGAASIGFLKQNEEFPDLAKKVGIANYDGLRFHNMNMQSKLEENKMTFSLTGEVINMTDKKMKLPVVNIKIFSKGGRVMGQSRFTMVKQDIEPFERIKIEPEIKNVSGNADKVELSFENWVESSLR